MLLPLAENGKGVELPNHAELYVLDQAACAEAYNSLPEDHVARQSVAIVDSVMCAARNNTDSCWVCILLLALHSKLTELYYCRNSKIFNHFLQIKVILKVHGIIWD